MNQYPIADWECDAVKRTELERQIGNRQSAIGKASFPIS
jgi:hypothetical protein